MGKVSSGDIKAQIESYYRRGQYGKHVTIKEGLTMKKFFVDTTGDGGGYVYEAETVSIKDAMAIFSSEGQITLVESNFSSVEVVTDEDVEYVEETEAKSDVGSAVQRSAEEFGTDD